MSANATGTPSTNYSIPKFNTASDAPNGKGVNEIVDALDTLLAQTSPTWVNVASLKQGGATTGQAVIWNGSAWAAGSVGSSLARTLSAPGGQSVASASELMLGFAGSITPAVTGKVRITIDGTVNNNGTASGSTAVLRLRTGTGAAPTNSAAVTGTAVGAALSWTQGTALTPFSLTRYFTGLALATALWIDMSCVCAGGATNTIQSINIFAEEIL